MASESNRWITGRLSPAGERDAIIDFFLALSLVATPTLTRFKKTAACSRRTTMASGSGFDVGAKLERLEEEIEQTKKERNALVQQLTTVDPGVIPTLSDRIKAYEDEIKMLMADRSKLLDLFT